MAQILDPHVVDVTPNARASGAMTSVPGSPIAAAPARSVPAGWIVGGVIALLAVGAGAYFAGRQSPTAPTEAAAAVAPTGKAANAGAAKAPGVRSDRVDASAPAPVCGNCGVVESVTAVKRKGEGSGVGAVAGTVVGGAVGNQFGKGDGRTAMTVLGAIGGAVAGHEVEKQVKATTVYVVKVRTDDGELRTVEQASAPAVGARVKVEGKTLKPLQG
ncbi:outer membrane lipoprotein [Leptothrix discophora]|uniref:Glycine zipper 2TM domain-containing protein n=1 Tax=Leptothrix discophora TaxID=89 RepID=A0ABT9G476_LEPDI|nr:glycine zipper 2TM domain-containing protein [Leptothrix discophora]MDP4301297.1 glycine zipper 2TM domain-containing protein [Leptothrix discophora]